MAVLVRGASRCRLCGDVIDTADAVVIFPSFIGNELDPLFAFNDAAFHERCFREHPLADDATRRLEESNARGGPPYRCEICAEMISDPDDFIFIEHLCDEPMSPLWRFNNSFAHRHCVADWPARRTALELAVSLRAAGKWKSRGLDMLITELERAGGTRTTKRVRTIKSPRR